MLGSSLVSYVFFFDWLETTANCPGPGTKSPFFAKNKNYSVERFA